MKESNFTQAWNMMSKHAHNIAIRKGWWSAERNEGELIALMHSELSECLEAMRHGNPQSNHIPRFSGIEEELADVIIRIMDYAAKKDLRIAHALIAKLNFNETRPHKHGGKKF